MYVCKSSFVQPSNSFGRATAMSVRLLGTKTCSPVRMAIARSATSCCLVSGICSPTGFLGRFSLGCFGTPMVPPWPSKGFWFSGFIQPSCLSAKGSMAPSAQGDPKKTSCPTTGSVYPPCTSLRLLCRLQKVAFYKMSNLRGFNGRREFESHPLRQIFKLQDFPHLSRRQSHIRLPASRGAVLFFLGRLVGAVPSGVCGLRCGCIPGSVGRSRRFRWRFVRRRAWVPLRALELAVVFRPVVAQVVAGGFPREPRAVHGINI